MMLGAAEPYRRCLKVDEWPASDQMAWAKAIKSGDLLDEAGLASHWSPASRHKNRRGYGQWLNFLQIAYPDLLSMLPAKRVTRDVVRDYLAVLQSRNLAPYTIVGRIAELTAVISKMIPNEDWSWLYMLITRLRHQARGRSRKEAKLLPTGQLFQFGLNHMNSANQNNSTPDVLSAVQFRDGLMIAFLAARPVRRSNLVAIRIDHHLVQCGDGWSVAFAEHETKTRRSLTFSIPEELISYLEAYLSRWRPHLLADRKSDRFWLTRYGKPMSDDAAYLRVTKVTERAFGKKINPHLFRDCAATTIAIEDPDHVRIGATILGHASLKTTERYYNHATSVEAGRQFQDSLVALRREMRETDKHDN